MSRYSTPFIIAVSYIRGKSESRIISLLSLLSVIGITLGISAMLVAVSIMNGFSKELKKSLLQFTPHIEIQALKNDPLFIPWDSVIKLISNLPEVSLTTPYVRGEAMIKYDQYLQGVLVYGIEEDAFKYGFQLQDKSSKQVLDALHPSAMPWQIISGEYLRKLIGLNLNQQVLLLSTNTHQTAIGFVPTFKKVTLASTYNSGIHSIDSSMVFMRLKDALILFSHNNQIDGLMVWLKDPERAPEVAKLIQQSITEPLIIMDWTVKNSNIFQAIALERKVMFLILFIIVLLATFNLSIALSQLVREKRSTIAILRTIGATPNTILKIFLYYGCLLVGMGILFGNVIGLSIAYNVPAIVFGFEQLFNIKILNTDTFIITQVPSQVLLKDVLIISLSTILLSLFFIIHPSYRASMIKPSDILRHD
ncbi:MAG: ABC transporter permease [Methylacidiphilales bacterium]|nr:ABC transporter permease [Candidatus Methylacidiphilales bacterium]